MGGSFIFGTHLGLQILLFIQSRNLHSFAGTLIAIACGSALSGDSAKKAHCGALGTQCNER